MKYNYDYTVCYKDVDTEKRIRWVALEECLLETAGTVADDLGFGIRQLHPLGLTWVLTQMSIEMQALPGPSDRLEFETWIEQNAHMLSVRNFRIYLPQPDGSRKQIGQAKSVWAVLDMLRREIVNCFDRPMFADSVDGEVLPMERAPRLRPLTDAPEHPYTIRQSDLDYNRHCNSCKYLQAMLDAYYPEWLNTAQPVRLDIHYAREVMLGEQVTIRHEEDEQSTRYQLLTPDGLTSCFATLRKIN